MLQKKRDLVTLKSRVKLASIYILSINTVYSFSIVAKANYYILSDLKRNLLSHSSERQNQVSFGLVSQVHCQHASSLPGLLSGWAGKQSASRVTRLRPLSCCWLSARSLSHSSSCCPLHFHTNPSHNFNPSDFSLCCISSDSILGQFSAFKGPCNQIEPCQNNL